MSAPSQPFGALIVRILFLLDRMVFDKGVFVTRGANQSSITIHLCVRTARNRKVAKTGIMQ